MNMMGGGMNAMGTMGGGMNPMMHGMGPMMHSGMNPMMGGMNPMMGMMGGMNPMMMGGVNSDGGDQTSDNSDNEALGAASPKKRLLKAVTSDEALLTRTYITIGGDEKGQADKRGLPLNERKKALERLSKKLTRAKTYVWSQRTVDMAIWAGCQLEPTRRCGQMGFKKKGDYRVCLTDEYKEHGMVFEDCVRLNEDVITEKAIAAGWEHEWDQLYPDDGKKVAAKKDRHRPTHTRPIYHHPYFSTKQYTTHQHSTLQHITIKL